MSFARIRLAAAMATIVAASVALVIVTVRSGTMPERRGDQRTSRVGADAAVPPRENTRALGFRLLTLADAEKVRAGVVSLTEAAEGGDVEAQVALGRIYLQGLPAVPNDPKRAHDWFARAERAQHPSAAYFQGVMSQNGIGTRADAVAAAHWFEIAAQRGSPHAMFMLANAYRAGAGVPKDDAKAVALYAKAGEMEHAAALQTLAMAYQRGELGLAPDEEESRRYTMEAEHAIKHPPALP